MSDSLKAEVVEFTPLTVRPGAKEQEGAQSRLREIADGLLEQNLSIMESASAFGDIDPADAEPPPEWVKQFGEEGARRRHRIARAAWLSSKDAPVGIANARALVVGMMKSKAMENAAPKHFSVVTVQLTEPQLRKALEEEFPIADVE